MNAQNDAEAMTPAEGVRDFRRDRLLAALALIAGLGLLLALPFALRAGAEFFLPVTGALVIAIALVPMLEWLERRGVPSALAAVSCVILFLVAANVAVASIIVPATAWFALLPDRIGLIRSNLAPLIQIYATIDRFVDDTVRMLARTPGKAAATVAVETPNSLLDLIATSAPHAIVQAFFSILLIYFFLAGWTRMRRRTIQNRTSFSSAMTTARVIQEMVDATSAYLGMITLINLMLGCIVAAAMWAIGMPTPLMWGRPRRAAQLCALPRADRGGAAARARRADDLSGYLVCAGAAGDLRMHPSGRGERADADDRRQAADDQSAADPRRAQLLGLGVGGRPARCSRCRC